MFCLLKRPCLIRQRGFVGCRVVLPEGTRALTQLSTQVLRLRPAINKQISFRFSVRLFIIGLGTRAAKIQNDDTSTELCIRSPNPHLKVELLLCTHTSSLPQHPTSIHPLYLQLHYSSIDNSHHQCITAELRYLSILSHLLQA